MGQAVREQLFDGLSADLLLILRFYAYTVAQRVTPNLYCDIKLVKLGI